MTEAMPERLYGIVKRVVDGYVLFLKETKQEWEQRSYLDILYTRLANARTPERVSITVSRLVASSRGLALTPEEAELLAETIARHPTELRQFVQFYLACDRGSTEENE